MRKVAAIHCGLDNSDTPKIQRRQLPGKTPRLARSGALQASRYAMRPNATRNATGVMTAATVRSSIRTPERLYHTRFLLSADGVMRHVPSCIHRRRRGSVLHLCAADNTAWTAAA